MTPLRTWIDCPTLSGYCIPSTVGPSDSGTSSEKPTSASDNLRRLHDARHTTATVLLLLGVPERAVMGIMGWSKTGVAARYQHITGTVLDTVAEKIGDHLWQRGPEQPDTSTDDN